MSVRKKIVFHVNHRRFEISGKGVFQTLSDFLRYELGLTGTKVVCAEGDCGACTTLLGTVHDIHESKFRYKAVNSCILPLFALDSSHIITVEGLKIETQLHPAQKSMVENFGSQCGYCTPGFICAMAAMTEDAILKKQTNISEKKARNSLTGNLCRCTGYEAILQASQKMDLTHFTTLRDRYHDAHRLQECLDLSKQSVQVEGDNFSLYLPSTLDEASVLKAEIKNLRVIAGATDTGVVINKGRDEYMNVLSLQNIRELHQLKKAGSTVEIGARVTLTRLEKFIETEVPELGRMLHIFASPQIKNSATLVGNIVNASPIADCIPFLMVNKSFVKIQSAKGVRSVPVEKFYLGYKKLDMREDEFVCGIEMTVPNENSILKLYKASRRKDLDISAVTLAVDLKIENKTVREARIAFGGIGPTVLRMKDLEDLWKNAKFERDLIKRSNEILSKNIKPLSDVRGTAEFRTQLCQNLLLKFHDELASEGQI